MIQFAQILSLIGLSCALLGSISLANRVFKKIVSLKTFLNYNFQDSLSAILYHIKNDGDTRNALRATVRTLNIIIIDIESEKDDAFRRAKKGMALLITGTILQAAAIFITLCAGP